MSAPADGPGGQPTPVDAPAPDTALVSPSDVPPATTTDGPPPRPAPAPAPGSFAVAVVVAVLAVYLTYGYLTMDVSEGSEGGPGPRFFPGIVLLVAWGVTVGLVVDAVRARRRAGADRPEGEHPDGPAPTDWRAVGTLTGVFAVFVVALVPVGWLLSGAFLFWGAAQALGSRRRLFDAGVGLAIASVVQLVFGAVLGLGLPAGLLGVG